MAATPRRRFHPKVREERAKWVAGVSTASALAIFVGVIINEYVNPAIEVARALLPIAGVACVVLLWLAWIALSLALSCGRRIAMNLESDLLTFLAWFFGFGVPVALATWAYETWAAQRAARNDQPSSE
jgi:hypothetical protein